MQNPLFESQREKTGSITISKYSYQYHWALERAILEHKKCAEYLIFIEYHEDVVFANSMASESANFDFSQVKTNAKPFTVNSLTKSKPCKQDQAQRSVIGKLLESTQRKSYRERISSINIVSANGFSLKLKSPDLRFEKIHLQDLADVEIDSIRKKLCEELDGCELPSNLCFVIPQLKEENHQEVIIGKISELLESLFPDSRWNSTHIYRALFDDLIRKGQNTFDYQNWQDAITKKALTSQQVTETLNAYTSHKDAADIEIRFQAVIDELGYGSIKSRNIRKGFDRHKNQMIGSRSQRRIGMSQLIRKCIDKHLPNVGEDLDKLLNLVLLDIRSEASSENASDNEFLGAVIYEFIAAE